MTQRALALALDISGAMVSKLKARGMPVSSVPEAEAWRAANLEPGLLKQFRRPELCRPAAREVRDRVAECNALGVRVAAAIDAAAWPEFVVCAEELRAAMVLLTETEEDRVSLRIDVWDALTGQPGPWSAHVHFVLRR